jgi:hypothetical protein
MNSMFDRKPHEMNANLKAIGNGFETFAHINPEIDENFEFIFHIIFRQLFRVFLVFVFVIKGQESYDSAGAVMELPVPDIVLDHINN